MELIFSLNACLTEWRFFFFPLKCMVVYRSVAMEWAGNPSDLPATDRHQPSPTPAIIKQGWMDLLTQPCHTHTGLSDIGNSCHCDTIVEYCNDNLHIN